MQKDNQQDSTQNNGYQYIGNIWGWKFSFISLGIIVAMLLLMLYRHYAVVKTYPPGSDKQTIIIEDDSSRLESQSID